MDSILPCLQRLGSVSSWTEEERGVKITYYQVMKTPRGILTLSFSSKMYMLTVGPGCRLKTTDKDDILLYLNDKRLVPTFPE